MKERNLSYDLIRVVACIMIICMHSPMPNDNAIGFFNFGVSYFTEPGLCLFFVISGALLLPVKTDTFTFLKKRLGKVVMPTVCFTFLYLLLNVACGSNVNWVQSLCSIPFSAQGHGVLWFMYTLIGLYLASPIISKWLKDVSKKELELYLALWGISLCYPILKLFLAINETTTGILYLFSGYLGYFVLGHYLKRFPDALPLKAIGLPVLISALAPVLCKMKHIEVGEDMFSYLSIFIASLTIFYYKLASRIKLNGGGKLTNLIVLTSNLSFGIYLIHIAVMRFFLWKQDWIININNYILQWLVVVLLTLILSWLVAYSISLLPFGDYIIGFKRNKK